MKLTVLVLEDERGVREALMRDLAGLAGIVRLEAAEDVEDARAILVELATDQDLLALVLADHRLPGESGVDFLVELHDDPDLRRVRKVLVTGQADQGDTIRAVNDADLDHYVAKPWDPEALLGLVRDQLTGFVVDAELDPLPHLPVLDAARVAPLLKRRGDA